MARFVSAAATLGLLSTGLVGTLAHAEAPAEAHRNVHRNVQQKGPYLVRQKGRDKGREDGREKGREKAKEKAKGGQKAPRAGSQLLDETFTGATADSRFTAVGSACLTGAPPAPAAPGSHPLTGCPPLEIGPMPPLDAAPNGYLRLTDAGNDQSGAVLFDQALPAGNGLDVSFDQWQYGSTTPNTPADGISFFLVNGDTSLAHPGAFGGSLGYAQKLPDDNPGLEMLPGVDRGYLGVGLDVLGNYFGDWEHRGNGCATRSPAGTGIRIPAPGANMVTVRGPGDGIEGYCFVTATTSNFGTNPPWPSTLPGKLQGPLTVMPPGVTPQEAETLLEPSRRRVHVRLTPAPAPVLTVDVDFNDGTGPHQVLQTPAPMPVPSTYKFGFAGSTGLWTDIHLIRNVVVSTDLPLPELNLVKQVHEPRPGELTPGTPIQYDFVVTNSGDTPINDLAVNDPTVNPISCPVSVLEPGETVTCTGTYVITAADVAAGHVTNTARATGTSDGDPVTSPDSTVTVPIDAPAGMTIDKQVEGTGPFNVGQTVHYTYVVTNTGGTEIDNLAIVDDKVSGISCTATTLAPAGMPGDSTTCTGTYVVTAADADVGHVTNHAHATGTSNGTPVETPPTDATINVVGTSSLGLVKHSSTPGPVHVGDTITYSYTVTNTGETTLTDLAVFDDYISNVNCPDTTLAPGASTTCTATYKVTEADGALGHIHNRAQATATNPQGGSVISPESELTVPVIGTSALGLVKKADSAGPFHIGDTVTYTYTVTNPGQTTLTDIAITDDRAAGVTCAATTLAPGASTTCHGSYTVTGADAVAGHITNVAEATGTDPEGGAVDSPPSMVTVPVVQASSLDVTKHAGTTGPVNVGDHVTYTYTVTNSGNTTLHGIAVVDDKVTGVACDRTTLAPGESATCTGTYTVTAADATAGHITNHAHATGTNPQGETVRSPDAEVTLEVNALRSALTLTKHASTAGPVHVGDTVTYTYGVTNSGETTLTDIAINDDKVTGVTCQATTLAPGASTTCTGTYTVTAADAVAGNVTNRARATGNDPQGDVVQSPEERVSLDVTRPASALTVTKKADTAGPVEPGDTITYTYTVTNSGTTTLNDVAVTDDKVTGVTCRATTLAPGESTTCTGTYTVTEADAVAGHVTNHAHATATDPQGNTVESPSVQLRVPAVCPPKGYDDYGNQEVCPDHDHGHDYGDDYGNGPDKKGGRNDRRNDRKES